jgi:Fe-S-cluster-containing hydrogenase component 2
LRYYLVSNKEVCTGCLVCTLTCSLSHEGVCNPFLARVQILKWPEKGLDIPMICRQCEKAPCAAACPENAISRSPETSAWLIDENKCIGCRKCLEACPFGMITVHPETMKMLKCDLCHGLPQCVKACETKALRYLHITELVSRKKKAIVDSAGNFK